jgi:hypothetical protein
MPTLFRSRFLAPKDGLKIVALDMARKEGGGGGVGLIGGFRISVGKFLVSPEDVV